MSENVQWPRTRLRVSDWRDRGLPMEPQRVTQTRLYWGAGILLCYRLASGPYTNCLTLWVGWFLLSASPRDDSEAAISAIRGPCGWKRLPSLLEIHNACALQGSLRGVSQLRSLFNPKSPTFQTAQSFFLTEHLFVASLSLWCLSASKF